MREAHTFKVIGSAKRVKYMNELFIFRKLYFHEYWMMVEVSVEQIDIYAFIHI